MNWVIQNLPMLIDIFVFFIGAAVGSVVNALSYRLPNNLSWLHGRSKCPKCKHELGFLDLIPLLSYLGLSGKCRYCKKPIGIRYFLVELVIAIMFVVISLWFVAPSSWILMAILAVTMLIAVMDWETQLIADMAVVIWGVLVISYQLTVNNYLFNWTNMLIAVGVGVGIIGGIWLTTKRNAMGEGDIGLAVVMGLWLGWPNVLVALWVAFVCGGVVGAVMIISGRKKLKSKIAFGPFLIIGSWVAFLYGSILVKWIAI